jgi:tetrahydrodipicolinate N-succinyltransferase
MSESDSRHAPWWVYAVIIVGVNVGKNAVLPDDAGIALTAGSTIVTIAALYWLITVVYRRTTSAS